MESTELSLPPELPFPVTVSSIDLQEDAEVERGTRLLTYSYVYTSRTTGVSETRFGTWDSPIEGTLEAWKVKPGDVISQRRTVEVVVLIKEPCKHGMQIGGLCGICGKDVTDSDYTGFSYASRANIQMTHSAKGPTVSLEEAQRLERQTAEHLLKSRKLSLIVDLDQTIVHATVDPTVGDWITEGEAWEARRKDGGPSSGEDDVNPNWEALKDVKKFTLAPEGVTPRSRFHPKIDIQGCMYYIKPRPGLLEFLEKMNNKYEMHVYTMGTRAYAEAVCAALDPQGTIFGNRILSRDESGSLTQKSLQRLFPCDTSMVVIIDDRADVWEWSPNLLKVRPYDFFVGIGDINSAFLPKTAPLVPSTPTTPAATPSSPPEVTEDAQAEADAQELALQSQQTIERIVAEVEERPLAKKQEQLEEDDPEEDGVEKESVEKDGDKKEDDKKPEINGEKKEDAEESKPEEPKPQQPHPHHHHHRKALLKNDDTELVRLANLLEEVHGKFYDAYDARLPEALPDKRKATLVDGRPVDASVAYDVKLIIPRLRARTLAGVHIVFSSVIPLDVNPRTTEMWKTAEIFGATCHTALSKQVTHLVAAKRGTAKVDAARRKGGIYVVWAQWLVDSLACWHRQDETPYLIDGEAPTNAVASGSTTPPLPEEEPEEEEVGDLEDITPDVNIWADASAEVDAFLDETDDEDGGDMQDDEGDAGWKTDESNISNGSAKSERPKGRKRSRSSSVGLSRPESDEDDARSPLAKRKKISEARRGASGLKVGIVAEDVDRNTEDEISSQEDTGGSAMQSRDEQGSSDAEESGAGGFDDDDFLAGELEEEEDDETGGG
ncbi:hypothetical protein M422DRAFT_198518 [Sphaerobolus stellatus SS14]|nr:hypothetical protein M422DRAFT_198518 [Sphaerobolus stellatus SS14]